MPRGGGGSSCCSPSGELTCHAARHAPRRAGNMAVSNAFGSNTFNIFVALALPWCVLQAARCVRYMGGIEDDIVLRVLYFESAAATRRAGLSEAPSPARALVSLKAQSSSPVSSWAACCYFSAQPCGSQNFGCRRRWVVCPLPLPVAGTVEQILLRLHINSCHIAKRQIIIHS